MIFAEIFRKKIITFAGIFTKRTFNKMKLIGFKRLIIIFVSIVTLIISFSAYLLFFPNIVTKNEKDTFICIYDTDNYDSIIVRLQEINALRSKQTFDLAARLIDYPNNVKSGCYLLKHNMTNLQLLHRLKNKRQTPVLFTFNNIRTKEDFATRVAEQLEMDATALLDLLNNDSILAEYDFNKENVPAMFIPNTYEMYWDISPIRFFEKMHDEYEKFWDDMRREKAAAASLTPIEAAILASIVEEESNKRAEKPIIAGLYINRLRKGMELQADPTAKFALGDFSLRRVRNVRSIKSPYNTYLFAGLPPGPIRIPSIETVEAVLNYDHNNYIFMCAKDDFSGKHAFSTNLAEHERNRQKYIKALDERGIGVKDELNDEIEMMEDTIKNDTIGKK